MTSQQVSDGQYLWHPSAAGTTAYSIANSVNQYPSVAGQALTYDGNGNLTFDGINQYSFDTENHLVTANWILGSTLWRYRYDAVERQAQKEVSPTKTRFIYTGWQRIADYDGISGLLQTRYVYGGNLDDILIKVDSAGIKTYYAQNHQGSVVALSNSTGAVMNRFKYGPSGESPSLTGTTHGYTGQRFDSETGLYYFKKRHYLARLGRFLQTDPLGTSTILETYRPGTDLNLYTYAINDPLNFADPLGLFPIEILVRPFRAAPTRVNPAPNPSPGAPNPGAPNDIVDPFWLIHPEINKGFWKKVPSPERLNCERQAAIDLESAKDENDRKKKRCKTGQWNPEIKTEEELEDEYHDEIRKCREKYPDVWRWFPGVEA